MNAAARSLAAAGRRWQRRGRLVAAIRVAALVLPPVAAAWFGWTHGAAAGAALLVAGSLLLALWGWRRWRPAVIDAATMARHLDRTAVELEESSELALAGAEDLPLLARLQRERVSAQVERRARAMVPPPAPLRWALVWLATSLAVSLPLPSAAAWLLAGGGRPPGLPDPAVEARAAEAGALAPRVRAVAVSIVPPAYTGVAAHTASGFDLTAEEGARVSWRLAVEGAVVGAALVFDESEALPLTPEADGAFFATRGADETRLYRLELTAVDGGVVRGPYARFEVLPDRPPELEIVQPERFLELPPARGQDVAVVVEARDDYGLGPMALVATVASGFGELVEFRERHLEFDRRASLPGGGWSYTSRLDLDALGVGPGVELFFFAEGEDRRRPEPNRARSATHIVRLPGEGTQSVGLSSRLPILRVPEFFRSQRQIILDTERLLADEPTITVAEFRRRSESLGFDQRALRQRYGGLLGEEFESGRPAGVDGADEEHPEEGRRLDEMEPGSGRESDPHAVLESLPQGLTHEHDSAEVATYFDSEIKAQLKAALAEMWGAEGRLRSLEPRPALPFEYRALTLLKQVQQRSRLYVQKVGFEAPVLYPEEKRLSGELDAIASRRVSSAARSEPELDGVRLALAALNGTAAPSAVDLLTAARAAVRLLAERARREPELDLAGLEAVRGWITALEAGAAPPPEVGAAATAALWQLLPTPPPTPELESAGTTDLETGYKRRLEVGGAP